jgi:hypothetical protein
MSIKRILVLGLAATALSSVAWASDDTYQCGESRCYDDQADETRRLNLMQLEGAQAQNDADGSYDSPDSDPYAEDDDDSDMNGQGGPYDPYDPDDDGGVHGSPPPASGYDPDDVEPYGPPDSSTYPPNDEDNAYPDDEDAPEPDDDEQAS